MPLKGTKFVKLEKATPAQRSKVPKIYSSYMINLDVCNVEETQRLTEHACNTRAGGMTVTEKSAEYRKDAQKKTLPF